MASEQRSASKRSRQQRCQRLVFTHLWWLKITILEDRLVENRGLVYIFIHAAGFSVVVVVVFVPATFVVTLWSSEWDMSSRYFVMHKFTHQRTTRSSVSKLDSTTVRRVCTRARLKVRIAEVLLKCAGVYPMEDLYRRPRPVQYGPIAAYVPWMGSLGAKRCTTRSQSMRPSRSGSQDGAESSTWVGNT